MYRSADEEVHAAELVTAIRGAIAALPARCRLIFLLHREHDLSYGEIAGRLGLSVKTVETQMVRALKVLRTHIRPHA